MRKSPIYEQKYKNSTKSPARVLLDIYTEQNEARRGTLIDKEITVYPTYPTQVNPMSIKITKTEYAEGECHLRAKMIRLHHPDHKKGEELEIVSVRFWIATDPPLSKGAFKEVQYCPRSDRRDRWRNNKNRWKSNTTRFRRRKYSLDQYLTSAIQTKSTLKAERASKKRLSNRNDG